MDYVSLPVGMTVSPKKFIFELNKALSSLDGFQVGMVILSDDNGYWLEYNGSECDNASILLSQAKTLVEIN